MISPKPAWADYIERFREISQPSKLEMFFMSGSVLAGLLVMYGLVFFWNAFFTIGWTFDGSFLLAIFWSVSFLWGYRRDSGTA